MDNRKFLIEKYGKGGLIKKNRYQVYPVFNEMGFKVGCEVGVAAGRNAARMIEAIPGLKLALVDNYADSKDYVHKGKSADVVRKIAKRRIIKLHKKYDFEELFIRKDSLEAVKDFEDESLDFVYIDCNHSFDYVIRDIIEWGKKVKIGGVISGHDYYKFKDYGVVLAVDAYMAAHDVRPVYFTNDRTSTYFWVKVKEPSGLKKRYNEWLSRS